MLPTRGTYQSATVPILSSLSYGMTAMRAPFAFQNTNVPVRCPFANAPATRNRPSAPRSSYAPFGAPSRQPTDASSASADAPLAAAANAIDSASVAVRAELVEAGTADGRDSDRIAPAIKAFAPSALSPRPPCGELAHDAAAEREHADDEDHARDHRDPFAEAGEIVLQSDDDERADHRAEDRAHASQQRHQHDLARHRPVHVGERGELEHDRLRGAGEPGERGRQHEREQLVALGVVAERDRARL